MRRAHRRDNRRFRLFRNPTRAEGYARMVAIIWTGQVEFPKMAKIRTRQRKTLAMRYVENRATNSTRGPTCRALN